MADAPLRRRHPRRPRGRLLLQERDDGAPIDPDCWGLVGGRVEDGEDFEPAAYRELLEETGVVAEPGRSRCGASSASTTARHGTVGTMRVYVAPTRSPTPTSSAARAARSCSSSPVEFDLALTSAAADIVPEFRDSDAVRRTGRTPGLDSGHGPPRVDRSPRDLRHLGDADLDALATEIRDFLVLTCSRTGGHLGPNLGVVELTMALHRVFDSPSDRIVFDTGHQAYVHKLLTGRMAGFDRLRQEGGVSGYPSQAESDHDIVENSHASTALSYADGLAKAYRLRGEQRHVVAVIGDGALTGGMAWEALNNIAVANDSRLVIVVNDNERSYTPTVGGLATALSPPAHQPALRAAARRGQEAPQRRPRRRPGGVRRPARDEEGHEGRPRARRASSRTSASSTSAPSTVTTGTPSSRR